MILQVEEEWGIGIRRRTSSGANEGLSVGDSFFEGESDLGCVISSSEETVPKILEAVANIGRLRTKSMNPKDDARYKTIQDARWVGRLWRNIEVQI